MVYTSYIPTWALLKHKEFILKFSHIPVLLEETINNLNIVPDGIYVDGTIGGAGHSSKIIEKLSNKGLLIGIDRDEEALKSTSEKLHNYNNLKLVHGNHDDIKEILEEQSINEVDGILLDLGVSSYQIDTKDRGFSYLNNGPLDMRMDKSQELTAEIIVNEYEEDELERILRDYGEERFYKRIVKNICTERKKKRIETTEELVKIVLKSKPMEIKKPEVAATQTFQALRIEVNNEIEPLYNTIMDSIKCLKNKGRLCVITFHSLEDRAVKNAFNDAVGKCTCPPDLPYCVCGCESLGKVITKKPIIPSDEEIRNNTRSRSAKLRVFERKK